jgi:hypothetical protein
MEYQHEKVNAWHFEPKDDPVGYIVVTHLYVEHGLDFLIYKKCKNQKRILKDHRTYTFAVKLDLCFELGLFPEFLYENIKTLNSLRNKMVHNLDVDYKSLKLHFTASTGEKVFPIGDFVNNEEDSEGITLMIMNLGIKTLTPMNTLITSKYLSE